ncbi:hypothetical protein CANTEDRAFT_135779 [Yamadazyma tenuis ATCC 10573]|uniref:Uncharacterized protein n=2 Tax=Candida tenuis TaxID=2315449 RepID=G3B9A3_CANTC|nr:uncharacterized protein CANTEDRAFT_135779 [Yamadazyma tenuis ATCC 10573]EGV61848.1 hypothetical protein CANTEDRAFT_135779 [Yamadazyma tenuis ATCC 10573]
MSIDLTNVIRSVESLGKMFRYSMGELQSGVLGGLERKLGEISRIVPGILRGQEQIRSDINRLCKYLQESDDVQAQRDERIRSLQLDIRSSLPVVVPESSLHHKYHHPQNLPASHESLAAKIDFIIQCVLVQRGTNIDWASKEIVSLVLRETGRMADGPRIERSTPRLEMLEKTQEIGASEPVTRIIVDGRATSVVAGSTRSAVASTEFSPNAQFSPQASNSSRDLSLIASSTPKTSPKLSPVNYNYKLAKKIKLPAMADMKLAKSLCVAMEPPPWHCTFNTSKIYSVEGLVNYWFLDDFMVDENAEPCVARKNLLYGWKWRKRFETSYFRKSCIIDFVLSIHHGTKKNNSRKNAPQSITCLRLRERPLLEIANWIDKCKDARCRGLTSFREFIAEDTDGLIIGLNTILDEAGVV